MHESQRLSAGQFAQLLQIDRHELDHLDALGWFVPAERDKNGRRTYYLSQINEWLSLQTTLDLQRDLQLDTTTKPNEADHLAVLKQQQALVDQLLGQLNVAQSQIAQEITGHETAQRAIADEVTIVNRPTVGLLTTDVPEATPTLTAVMQQHVQHVLKTMPQPPVNLTIGRVHPKHALMEGDADQLTTLYTPLTFGSQTQPDQTLATGRYVIAYHHLDQPLLHGYDQLVTFAKSHDLTLGAAMYEQPIISSWQAADPAQQVVRLLMAVKEG